jgi:hypothetical protein
MLSTLPKDSLLAALVSESALMEVDLPAAPSAWLGHVPFALWLVEQVRPGMLVELGTHYGHSYFTFCASIASNGLPCRCFAVDTWQGDEHAGSYGEEIFQSVAQRNRDRYDGFSRLLRMTFDEAAAHFGDGTIDLLHIDGLHTYEAVKHDFETWEPKLSSRAVVLFHDTNVRERDFGVWRLWEELSARHPHLEFQHSHGLGVLFTGSDQPPQIRELLRLSPHDAARMVCKRLFARLGKAVELQSELRSTGTALGEVHQRLAAALQDAAGARARQEERERGLVQTIEHLTHEVSIRDGRLVQLAAQVAQLTAERSALLASSSWRLSAPIRWVGQGLGRLRARPVRPDAGSGRLHDPD